MAYCNHCGAYIPDGQTRCLACGYDENEEQAAAQAAAAQAAAYAEEAKAREQAEEERRAEFERRRAQRQESNRVWAENEQRNRRMEQDFQRKREMEEQFRRHQQESEERARSYVNRSSSTRQTQDEERTGSEGGNRGIAALSYLGILLLIPMFSGQNDDYVKFHTKQGSKLLLATVIGNILGSIFSFAWAVDIVALILAIMGIGNAINGRKQELPVIGKWFKF